MDPLVPFELPLATGRLVRRYKRFFVDATLDEPFEGARDVVVHTANTGAMTGLVDPGTPVLLTRHTSITRKIPWELEAVRVDGPWTMVNTHRANAFVQRVVERQLVPELGAFSVVRREVSPSKGSSSRFDFFLEGGTGTRPCWLEVKSVTLRQGDRALFPDAVTERGKKHLEELARLVGKTHRAAMLYVCQRPGCTTFAPAADIDPNYARALTRAVRAGVEVYCVGCSVDERGLSYAGQLAVDLA